LINRRSRIEPAAWWETSDLEQFGSGPLDRPEAGDRKECTRCGGELIPKECMGICPSSGKATWRRRQALSAGARS